MDPSVVYAQVQGSRYAVAAHVKLASDKALQLKNVFIHPKFTLDLISVLEDVVGDSVVLHARCERRTKHITTDPDFLTKQARRINAAVDDLAQVQLATADLPELTTVSEAFALDVIEDISAVLRDNVSAATEFDDPSDYLSMCKPLFSSSLFEYFRYVVYSHATQRAEIAPLRQARTAAEAKLLATTHEKEKLATAVRSVRETVVQLQEAVRELQDEVQQGKAGDEAAQTQVVLLEQSLSVLQEDNVRLRRDAKSAELAAQDLARKLDTELNQAHTAHLNCDLKVQARDDEIVRLRGECRKIIGTHQEQLVVSTKAARQLVMNSEEKFLLELERNKLVAELSRMKESYRAFGLFRAQERERMTAERVRLRKSLNLGGTPLDDTLVEENMQLKTRVQALEAELGEANTKLSGTLESCNARTAALDNVVFRNALDVDSLRQAAAKEREIDTELLYSAARKVEDLEAKIREQADEIVALREAQTTHKDCNGLNLALVATSTLPSRMQELVGIPQVLASVPPPGDVTKVFTKTALASILGGYVPNIIGRCTASATELARKHGIREYLCPRMEQHLSFPARPGKHGYLQFGFGKDSGLFVKGEYRHVFVGTGKFFAYYGFYHVLRVESLTSDEWASVPMQMKMVYSDLAVNRDKSDKPKTVQQTLADFESGAERVPCVRLQCVAFNTEFYGELVHANKEYVEEAARRNIRKSGRQKRRRVAAGDGTVSDETSDDVALATLANAKRRNPAGSNR